MAEKILHTKISMCACVIKRKWNCAYLVSVCAVIKLDLFDISTLVNEVCEIQSNINKWSHYAISIITLCFRVCLKCWHWSELGEGGWCSIVTVPSGKLGIQLVSGSVPGTVLPTLLSAITQLWVPCVTHLRHKKGKRKDF